MVAKMTRKYRMMLHSKMIKNRNLLAIPRKEYAELTDDLEKNVEVVEIENIDHLQNNTLGTGLNFYRDTPRSQYIELINVKKIYLGTIISKLQNAESIEDPVSGNEIDPAIAVDQLVRYSELSRDRDKQPIFAYKDKRDGLIYGCVSKKHTYLPDNRVFKIMENHVKDIPHEADYYHNIFQWKIDYRFPDTSLDLGDGNKMDYVVSAGGSAYGMRAAYVCASAREQVCANGMMAWVSKFSWRQIHVGLRSELLLTRYLENFNSTLSGGTAFMELLRQANEVGEAIIDQYANVVEQLRSKRFNLLKTEAEDIYRRIRTETRYQRLNAFDVGRAIAEQARDTISLNRRIELEQLAGRVMLEQVKI